MSPQQILQKFAKGVRQEGSFRADLKSFFSILPHHMPSLRAVVYIISWSSAEQLEKRDVVSQMGHFRRVMSLKLYQAAKGTRREREGKIFPFARRRGYMCNKNCGREGNFGRVLTGFAILAYGFDFAVFGFDRVVLSGRMGGASV